MGVSGLINVTDKKKNVYVVENGVPPPQTDFTPVGAGRHHTTTRTSAKWVAYFEIILSVLFWFPVLNVFGYLSLFVEYLSDNSAFRIIEDPQEAAAAMAVSIRFLASLLLLFGTYKNRSWMAVPYLLIQMFLVFGAPFMVLYSSLGCISECMSSRAQLTMIVIILVCVFIWVEFFKWRTVYNFYDSLTFKRISEDFAKLIENETTLMNDEKEGNGTAKTETEWYMKQVYQSATMQEIDPREVESLVPARELDSSTKDFSFQNAKLELKE